METTFRRLHLQKPIHDKQRLIRVLTFRPLDLAAVDLITPVVNREWSGKPRRRTFRHVMAAMARSARVPRRVIYRLEGYDFARAYGFMLEMVADFVVASARDPDRHDSDDYRDLQDARE
jgi:hypothetical protein